jgi:hypothetical protein
VRPGGHAAGEGVSNLVRCAQKPTGTRTLGRSETFSAGIADPMGVPVVTVDQAFWQLFHAVEARLSSVESIDRLASPGVEPGTDDAVALNLGAPVHAVGVLRREAERRHIDYPTLIAALSEERRGDLPAWWLAIARSRGVGVLPPDQNQKLSMSGK